MIASMSLEDESGAWEGPLKPSTEWPFHHRILRERPDANAVVHAHPAYCTTLAIARKEIPACHYMIASFGGNNVRCAGYVRFGTDELSRLAVAALEDRTACLLANHGMITIGDTLAKAMWRAVELETIARQYYLSLQIGGPTLLSDAEVEETLAEFAGYGVQDDAGRVETAGARSLRRDAEEGGLIQAAGHCRKSQCRQELRFRRGRCAVTCGYVFRLDQTPVLLTGAGHRTVAPFAGNG